VVSNACGSLASQEAAYTVCPADFDCGGSLEVGDVFAMLAGWFGLNPRADWNGDHLFSVPDIFGFLTSWFAGCPLS
jgi:hypothetical protein